MNLVAFKLVAAAVWLCIGLIGGFAPLKLSQISQVAMHITYAFAGGILAAVAVVHMLASASGGLEDTGTSFANALGGGDGFPLGNALFLIGFFLISFIEALLHHNLGASKYDQSGHDQDHTQPLTDGGNNAGGWATLVGLSIHSIVEGIATGAVTDEKQEFFVVLAVVCHKGFAAFANASANISLLRNGQQTFWKLIVLWFAFTGPIGLLIGLAASANLDGVGTDVITALAAGSLLSVGVSEMLLPAFSEGRCLGWKLLVAASSMLVMALFKVWT